MSGDSRKATAASMSAVQDAMRQQQQEAPAGLMWPWRCPLFDESFPLIVYVLTVLAGYFTFTGFEVVGTAVTAGDITLFTGLMCCGALCVEATRRLGQPSGVWRDLLSAWWLPVALLLPPLYALIAPAVLGLLIYVRVRRGALYRRVFSTAALGLAGAGASALFRLLAPAVAQAQAADWLTYPGPKAWLMRPQQAGLAVVCAVAFIVLNTCLVAIACALSAILLVVALPPVILLQRSLLHSQLKAQARTDPKTGVLNAGAWQGEAALAIARAQRHREPMAVLLADVDHFKMVNDTHGHLTGDAVLRTLATEMRQQVRESDLVGRFGGEEFVIALTATGEAEACQVAERIRRGACVVKVLTPDTIVGVTVSIGVAALGSHGTDLFELLAAADIALYRAKNTGRDRVCVYDPADKASGATGATGMTGAPGIMGAPGMTGASGAPQLN